MKVIVTESYHEMSVAAADVLEEEIRANPELVLGLATGSTPIGTYKELVRRHLENNLDFSRVKSFNLDEYVGLLASNPNSYRYFMNEHLFMNINIDLRNTYVPDGLTDNPTEYGIKYDEMIHESGGIRIQILGIGSNGHIAFNEPAEELSIGTGIVELTDQTIQDNARFFESIDDVPTQAISMGMGSIMKADRIILLASGKGKAGVIKKIVENGTVSTQIPASFLLLHPDVTLICDKDAYSMVGKLGEVNNG